MKRRTWLAALGTVLALGVGTAHAVPGGLTLVTINNQPVNPPGSEVGFVLKGAPFAPSIIAWDTDPGPTMLPFGVVNLGLSPDFFLQEGVANGDGVFRVDCIVDCDHPLFGKTVYTQGFQMVDGMVCISNGDTVLWDALFGECGGEDLCPGMGTKPQVLTMTYTGDDCSATSNSQEPGKVTCSGDPGFDPLVHLIATEPSGKDVWFEGDVALGGSFDVDATTAGKTRLKGDTVIEIYDMEDGTLLQRVQFHTSCSQPLIAGDQYGGVRLDGFVAEP